MFEETILSITGPNGSISFPELQSMERSSYTCSVSCAMRMNEKGIPQGTCYTMTDMTLESGDFKIFFAFLDGAGCLPKGIHMLEKGTRVASVCLENRIDMNELLKKHGFPVLYPQTLDWVHQFQHYEMNSKSQEESGDDGLHRNAAVPLSDTDVAKRAIFFHVVAHLSLYFY